MLQNTIISYAHAFVYHIEAHTNKHSGIYDLHFPLSLWFIKKIMHHIYRIFQYMIYYMKGRGIYVTPPTRGTHNYGRQQANMPEMRA